MSDSERQETPANMYARLPDPVRPEDLTETVDVSPQTVSLDDEAHEREWMLRHAPLM